MPDFILTESGDFLLLETGGRIIIDKFYLLVLHGNRKTYSSNSRITNILERNATNRADLRVTQEFVSRSDCVITTRGMEDVDD